MCDILSGILPGVLCDILTFYQVLSDILCVTFFLYGVLCSEPRALDQCSAKARGGASCCMVITCIDSCDKYGTKCTK